jgi:hypothetical protein
MNASTNAKAASSLSDDEIDAYNRRYSNGSEEYANAEEGAYAAEDSVKVNERRSDTEYSERIIRYHSPSKVTIAGADNVIFSLATDITATITKQNTPTEVQV